MKPFHIILGFCLFLFSCSSRQDEMTGTICDCYSKVEESEYNMTEEFRKEMYRTFLWKSKGFFKRNYYLGQAEHCMDVFDSYLKGRNVSKEEAKRNFNVMKSIFLFEASIIKGIRIGNDDQYLNKLEFENYKPDDGRILRKALEIYKHHYLNIKNTQERIFDEKLIRIMNQSGRKELEKYLPPKDLQHDLNAFYYCVDTTLFRALQTEPELLNKNLYDAVLSACPGAAKIIF